MNWMSAVRCVIGSLTAQQAVVLMSLPLFLTSILFRSEIAETSGLVMAVLNLTLMSSGL